MTVFSNIAFVLSAVMVLAGGIMFNIYSNEFFLREAPLEWHIVSGGMVSTGLVLLIRPFMGYGYFRMVWPWLLSLSAFIIALGFLKLYIKSVREAIR